MELRLLLDYPNKVFREVKTMGSWDIEPSSPAVSLIIAEKIQNDEGVRESCLKPLEGH